MAPGGPSLVGTSTSGRRRLLACGATAHVTSVFALEATDPFLETAKPWTTGQVAGGTKPTPNERYSSGHFLRGRQVGWGGQGLLPGV
jgi:hypothetical protein